MSEKEEATMQWSSEEDSDGDDEMFAKAVETARRLTSKKKPVPKTNV